MTETKACRRCGTEKFVGDFPANTRTRDGLSSWCRACHSARANELYRAHTADRSPLNSAGRGREDRPVSPQPRTKETVCRIPGCFNDRAPQRTVCRDHRNAQRAAVDTEYRRTHKAQRRAYNRRYWLRQKAEALRRKFGPYRVLGDSVTSLEAAYIHQPET